MDGKFSLNDRLILPRLAVHSQNFIFDLQRFDDPAPSSGEGGGTPTNDWGSETQTGTSVFSATVNGVTRYGTVDEFTTANLGNATAITLLQSFQAPATATTVSATVAPNVGLTLSNSCTLDLNGKTLTFASNIGIRVDSDETAENANILTVKDSGTGGKIDHTWESNTSSGNDISASNISSNSSDEDKKKAAAVVSAIKGNRQFSAIKLGYSQTTSDGTSSGTIIDGTSVDTNNKNGVGLTLLGGTIESKSSAVCAGNHSTIVINGGTLESSQSCGVYFGNVAPTVEGMHSSLTMTNGTIRSGANSQLPAIQVSGSMSEQFSKKDTDAKYTHSKDSTVTLDISGGTIEFTHAQDSLAKALNKTKQIDENKYAGNPEAIYAGSNTKLIVSGNAKITSTVTGVELRAGDLEVSGGTISTSATEYTTADKGSGTSGGTTYGAAIAISQHVSNQPIDVKVSGGTIEGANALAVSNTRGENSTDAEKKGKVTATIDGGTLRSKASSSSTDKASASGNAILSDKANVVITVNGGNLQGDVTVTKETTTDKDLAKAITTKATVIVAGGTTTGKVQVVDVDVASTEENNETVVDPEDSTLSDEEKTAIKESLNVVGGKITNTESANKYVNAGYTYTSEGVKEDTTGFTRGWAAVEGKSDEFQYSLTPTDGTPTVLAAATVGSGVTDTTGFKYDSTNFLFSIPDLSNVSLEANAANTYKVAGYSLADGNKTVTITPWSKGVKITSLAGGLLDNTITKLEITERENASGSSLYGAYVDATENNLSYMKGGKGQNTLIAGARNTTLETGENADADTLVGGDNTDTFIYTSGKGVIENYEYGTDIASISGDIAPPIDFENAYFDNSKFVFKFGDSKTLHFRGASQVHLLHGSDTYTYNENSSIAKEGSGISLGAGFTAKNYDGSDKGYGMIDAHWVTGSLKISAKDDNTGGTVIGAQGGGTLLGGTGSDLLRSSVTAADSKLTLDGGAYGDDSLVGNATADNLFIYRGGADSISGFNAGRDVIRLMGNDYAPGKATVSVDSSDLVLSFGDDNLKIANGGADEFGSFSVQGGTNSKNIYRFSKNQISYDKGVTLTSYYDSKVSDVTTFNGTAEGNTNYATINAAAVTVASGNAISIVGNANNNYIVGGSTGGNSLDGGTTGNDTLVGGTSGNDLFYYKGGKDFIGNFKAGDTLSAEDALIETIESGKATSSKLTFTINKKSDVLTFNFGDGDAISSVSTGENSYLTEKGYVKDNALTLFSSAKKTIDLATDTLYSGVSTVDATKVEKQGVTLVGGSGGLYKFNGSNKQKDGFTYGGGSASISGYEGGRDRIDLGTYSYSGFSVNGNDVVLNLASVAGSSISIASAKDAEVLLRENNKNSKLVFKADGVLENKAKNPTMATVSAGATETPTFSNKVKKIFAVGGVSNISLQAGNNNTVIDASKAGGVSLSGGNKNDKLIGATGKADMYIYGAGKDVIQSFGNGDQISLTAAAASGNLEESLTGAKITKSSSNIKFKFNNNNKNTLTVKAEKGTTFTNGQLQINGKTYTYLKNAVQNGGTVSLTSSFGGTFKTSDATQQTIDGHLVKNNLTFVGSTRDETFIGGGQSSKKTTFKGGGGADTLVGGESKDTFFYAKSYTGDAVIQSFDFKNDKLKVASGKIGNISKEGNNITIGMTNGQKNSSAIVGSFKITSQKAASGTEPTAITPDKVAFKANNTYYWFASEKDVSSYVSADDGTAIKAGQLITTENRLSALPTDLSTDLSGASVIDLNYSTNLAKSGVAIKVKENTST